MVEPKKARVFVKGVFAGYLEEMEKGKAYRFAYDGAYSGPPVSLTMPVNSGPFSFSGFPPFFDGLLPEGERLQSLLRSRKIDKNDLFAQLLAVGKDMVGAVTVSDGDGGE